MYEIDPSMDIQGLIDRNRLRLEDDSRIVILMKKGIYRQRIHLVGKHIKIIAESGVEIVYSQAANFLGKNQTFQTSVVLLEGMDITVEGLTIRNDAGLGEEVGQAVALYVHRIDIKFINCEILGNQDTLCIGPIIEKNRDGSVLDTPIKFKLGGKSKYLFSKCFIKGNVDYIFGGGSALFENCEIKTIANGKEIETYITAPCTPEGQKYGFVFKRCIVMSEDGYKNYLGRPWRKFAKAMFIECTFAKGFDKQGWSLWGEDPHSIDKVNFSEIGCMYSKPIKRPKWVDFQEKDVEGDLKNVDRYFNFN